MANPWPDRTEVHPARGCLCIHELIEAQVAVTPDAPAVITPDETLSYRELNRRANVLARKLQRIGVRPEILVGIYVRRSAAMIVGILATLKAGGAYVPLDQASPAERLADVDVSAVLYEEPSMTRLAFPRAAAICLDKDWHRVAAEADLNPGPLAVPANLAYVIYTSGSTGRPKGVAVEHRCLVNSTLARLAFYPPPRRFLLLSAVAFDSAVAGIFGTLARGGALLLPPAGVEADAREVARLIARHQVDTILALPSLYELILESAAGSQLRSLRTVTVAGERCPSRLVTKSRARVPAAELVNEYGPTEGTVWSTAWRAAAREVTDQATVPIGRPVDGVQIRILDPSGRPVPEGEAGEVCIAGAGVARGYVGRPDLTAASFVPDAAGPAGSRMYRSGDLARLRADGELEFLGRIDRQLKISGFRIEPAEVEEAIAKFPGVRQAVVVESPRATAAALAAFVTGAEVTPAELRHFLLGKLPAYMVPAEIRTVDVLPKTANGKVDHGGLALILAEADGGADNGADHETDGGADDLPCSATERVVARLWCLTLGRERIGRTDSFLDLGGSLDAMRIAVRLSQLFKVDVPLLWVYEAPTVESIAQWLESTVANASAIAERYLATHGEARDKSAYSL